MTAPSVAAPTGAAGKCFAATATQPTATRVAPRTLARCPQSADADSGVAAHLAFFGDGKGKGDGDDDDDVDGVLVASLQKSATCSARRAAMTANKTPARQRSIAPIPSTW